MIVESMSDQEFVLEVTRDYFDEMREYVIRAMIKKGKIKRRQSSSYTSKKGNIWLIIFRPEYDGQSSLHIKRPQPKEWYTWYNLILGQNSITLFGFNKHVAERISKRYHPELTPSEALKEMLIKTPAIIQGDTGKEFYTRVNGGVCIGSVYGKRFSINIGSRDLQVDLRDTGTFISDDMLYNDQKKITEESIARAIERFGRNYLSDDDREEI
jgi:hypothetical protein